MQLVCSTHLGVNAAVPGKRAQKILSGVLGPPLLEENVNDFQFVIDRAPQPHLPAADPEEHLVQMPTAGWRRRLDVICMLNLAIQNRIVA